MPTFNIKLDLTRNLNFSRNFQINAVRKTNVKTREEFHRIIAEKNTITPQDIGNVARRISIQSQRGKTIQERFFDMFI
ncbi:hypothetical protein DRQ09_06915 [candidate division KSB1 bacterium]|nr:MAG: hypothetical protein DRQ09_06915 [candidate division KSB1 bacterium]